MGTDPSKTAAASAGASADSAAQAAESAATAQEAADRALKAAVAAEVAAVVAPLIADLAKLREAEARQESDEIADDAQVASLGKTIMGIQSQQLWWAAGIFLGGAACDHVVTAAFF